MKFAFVKNSAVLFGLLLQSGVVPAATQPVQPERAAPPPKPVLCCGGNSGNPNPNASIQLGPIKDKPGELAVLTIKGTRRPLAAREPTTQYCVSTSITVTGKSAWTTAFEVALIDAAAATGSRTGFRPILVTTPIPAGTTRELVASPPWCANRADAAPAPSWVVRTPFGSRAVLFESNPTASPR